MCSCRRSRNCVSGTTSDREFHDHRCAWALKGRTCPPGSAEMSALECVNRAQWASGLDGLAPVNRGDTRSRCIITAFCFEGHPPARLLRTSMATCGAWQARSLHEGATECPTEVVHRELAPSTAAS